MSGGTGSMTGARVARELREFLRSDPFRFALAVSLLVHLALLCVVFPHRTGSPDPTPQMRVRIVRDEPEPLGAPAAAVEPAAATTALPADGVPLRPPPVETAPAARAANPAEAASPEFDEPPQSELPATAAAPEAPASPAQAAATAAVVTADAASAAEASAVVLAVFPIAPAGSGDPSDGAAPAGSHDEGRSSALAALSPPAATGGADAAAAAASRAGAGSAAGIPGPTYENLSAVHRRIEARKVYPPIAVRNGWQGRVLVEMHLAGDGSLAGVRLLRGSGYAVLDEATLATVRRAAPFPPVASRITVPVEYRLVP